LQIQQPPQERPPVSRKKLNYAILRDDNPLKHSNTSHWSYR